MAAPHDDPPAEIDTAALRERFGHPLGKHIRAVPPTACGACLLTAVFDEVDRLRERERIVDQWGAVELDRLRADYAATVAENERLRRQLDAERRRLHLVEAIEAGNVCPHGFEPGEAGCGCYMCRVRAAARGEGDR